MNMRLGRKFRLGLLINPYAGIGGALALKGSDGVEIRTKALALGAPQLAMQKATIALQQITSLLEHVHIYTGSGQMGESVLQTMACEYSVIHEVINTHGDVSTSEPTDTIALINKLNEAKIDLLLFAGGDGTARNICSALNYQIPVVGVPAGCKIHSSVYAITPKGAGLVASQVIKGELVSLQQGEVRDIDETRFREGQVIAKHFGEMLVPAELSYIQAVKMGGKESDELLIDDICEYVQELMLDQPDTYFVMGSGSTVDAIMSAASIDNTLLGVDIVCNQKLIASDVNANELINLTRNRATKLIITVIGGQGHILGRGNQQLSPAFIRQIGKANIILVATKSKLQALADRGLISDSGDMCLDAELAGPISVITGFRDQVLYFIRG